MGNIGKQLKVLPRGIRFIWPYAIVAGGSGTVLTEEIPIPKHSQLLNLNLSVLLPIKAGLIGVIAAALLAFWGFFWSEVVSENSTNEDMPAIVRSYRRSFGFFVPAMLLLFASTGADFYLLVVNSTSAPAASISVGTFAAALFTMLLFVVVFCFYIFVDMQNLYSLGDDS